MFIKKKLISTLLCGAVAMAVTNFANAGTHNDKTHTESSQKIGKYPTVGLEERIEGVISFSVAKVCPLFEPAGRFLMYDWWNPTILQPAKGDTLEGLIMSDRGFNLDILLKVTKHNPAQGIIEYIVLWNDFELQRINISCVEGETPNSTKIVWNEENSGLYKNGSAAVNMYVSGGHLRNNVENYLKNATKKLQTK
jgi:hypothetical protein